MSRAFGLVLSRGWHAIGTPAPSSCRRWRGCCVSRATPRRVAHSCWRRAACRTDRCTTTSRAAWKSSPEPHSRHRAPSSPMRYATHWTRHPTQGKASSDSSTSLGELRPGKNVPAARSRRPHSNHRSSAPVYAPPRRGASATGRPSSPPGYALTDGPTMIRPGGGIGSARPHRGRLLLARVSGQPSHLVNAKRAVLAILAAPPPVGGSRTRTMRSG